MLQAREGQYNHQTTAIGDEESSDQTFDRRTLQDGLRETAA